MGFEMQLQKVKPPEIKKETILKIVNRIVENFNPEKIVLFGSRVWGDSEEWSDIDLLVIMEFEGPVAEKAGEISVKSREKFVPMDILVYRPEEIEERLEMGDPFIQEIIEKGELLYEK